MSDEEYRIRLEFLKTGISSLPHLMMHHKISHAKAIEYLESMSYIAYAWDKNEKGQIVSVYKIGREKSDSIKRSKIDNFKKKKELINKLSPNKVSMEFLSEKLDVSLIYAKRLYKDWLNCDPINRMARRFEVINRLVKPPKEKKETDVDGNYTDKHGYRMIVKNIDGKKVTLKEHSWVMSQHLGRSLTKGENVHHKNGVRDDNRIENLELWSIRHPSGQRVEDKIDFYKKFLELYGYKVEKVNLSNI